MRAYRSEIEDTDEDAIRAWVTTFASVLSIARWIAGTVIVYHFAGKYW